MYSFIEMLRYKRPSKGLGTIEFAVRFLEPVFGEPDVHGNYVVSIGDCPKIAFMAHYDTVHRDSGKQNIMVTDGIVTSDGDCLGADCTTGVYIILNMIEAGVEGLYIVHADEEVGCLGSRAIVLEQPSFLDNIQCAISFDRFGTKSIITHQMGERTCSDDFADSLSAILGMDHEKDTKGSFTDSYEYRGIIPECTNLSVGYYRQHSPSEHQDLEYLDSLIGNLIAADWSKLVFSREPVVEFDDSWWMRSNDTQLDDEDELYQLVYNYPQAVADFLHTYGITKDDLMQELYQNGHNVNRYIG